METNRKNKKLKPFKIFFVVFFIFSLFLSQLIAFSPGIQTASAQYPNPPQTDQSFANGIFEYGWINQMTNLMKSLNNSAGSAFENVFIWLLKGVLWFVGIILSAATSTFSWVMKESNMNLMINGPKLYDSWRIIRDLLNIFFILILIYTAFTIIFQVDSTNKKVILTLIIMALLVNFSFPITRFIIDLSNSLMYTIINALPYGGGAGENALGEITRTSGIENLLHPGDNVSIGSLIAAIIFVFIYAVTLFATAILFVIRMIALAILIIFSPVAFVATILPSTNSYSSKWWDNLFRYAFFGPIMVLMLFVTTQLMVGFTNAKVLQDFYSLAADESRDPNIVGSIAYLSIPIILLWMGMGIGQSMSIAGAGAVMGGAQRFIRAAGRGVGNRIMGLTGINFLRRQAADYARERNVRQEQARFRWGRNIGRRVNQTQDELIGSLPGRLGQGARTRRDNIIRARNREEINNRVQTDGRDGNELLMDPANGLDVNVNVALDRATPGNVKRTHAVTAQALRNLGDSELRLVIENNAAGLVTSMRRGTGIFAGAPANVQASLNNINGTGTAPTPDDYQRVVGYLRTRTGQVLREGVTNP